MLNFLGGSRGSAGALTRPSTRHLLPKNFEKTALRKRGGIFAVKMGGGHNCGNYCTYEKNERTNRVGRAGKARRAGKIGDPRELRELEEPKASEERETCKSGQLFRLGH